MMTPNAASGVAMRNYLSTKDQALNQPAGANDDLVSVASTQGIGQQPSFVLPPPWPQAQFDHNSANTLSAATHYSRESCSTSHTAMGNSMHDGNNFHNLGVSPPAQGGTMALQQAQELDAARHEIMSMKQYQAEMYQAGNQVQNYAAHKTTITNHLEQELQRAHHYAEHSAQQFRSLQAKEHGDSPHSKRFCPTSEVSERQHPTSEAGEASSSATVSANLENLNNINNRILDPLLQEYQAPTEALHVDSTEEAAASQQQTHAPMPFSQTSSVAFSPY
jgi:hypothetical protein